MPERPRLHAVSPLLVVADLHRAIAFYRDRLGYGDANAWGNPPCFAMLHRDGCELMLSVAQNPTHVAPHGRHGVWDLYLRVTDLAAEIAALQANGTPIDKGPTDAFYGMREIEVLDPDGHRICIAQDVTPDSPHESWSATLDLGTAQLRLLLELRRDDRHWQGNIISLDQGGQSIPIDTVTRDDEGMHLRLHRIGAAFAGMFAAGGNELAGIWTQHGRQWPLVFTRN